jgi:CheY-like chemotaxis protein/signal transduction histidine kinase/HAMP domain-containing protein
VNLLAENLTNQVRAIAEVATAVTKGDLTRSIQVEARGEVAELKDNINTMIGNLRLTTERNTEQDWLKTNLAKFTSMLQGQRDLTTVGSLLLSELVPLVSAHQGLIYQMDKEDGRLKLLAKYADDHRNPNPVRLSPGEGFAGQCALDRRRILVPHIPRDSARIDPVLFAAAPKSLVTFPVLFEDNVKAVIVLASLHEFEPAHLTFLEQLTESIGIVLNSIEATMQTEGLLKQSQQLAAELQTRQTQLQQTNEQLELKAQQLAERNVEVERKNQEIEQARGALEEKAAELSQTSKYKSEFLANMSHELRTPLNSILILGQQLSENADGNLSPRQIEFAKTIHGAGTDLLNLISDILDLSKIESGTVSLDVEEISLANLVQAVGRPFQHEAEGRKLSFDIELDPNLGRSIFTDSKRLQQILKNLLSNAFKFTQEGGVRFRIWPALGGWNRDNASLSNAASIIAFEVSDTGIGIPLEKQKLIFEAFQQADASTSRKYGGTGLGLAISRELAGLLGGEIQLQSTPGRGSTFTLYLPLQLAGAPVPASEPAPLVRHKTLLRPAERPVEQVPDDRETISESDIVLLIVEDDPHFARVIADLAREHDFKVLIAGRGADALDLAKAYKPTAVTLDVFLPDMLGWSILGQLKQDPETRHIPVQMLTLEEDKQHGLCRGAFSFLTKPVETSELRAALAKIKDFTKSRLKRLVIIEDNEAEQLSIAGLLEHDDIDIETFASGSDALAYLRNQNCDCVVLDLKLPDMSGFEVLERIRDEERLRELPVIVFTGRDLSAEEEARLQAIARSVVLKGVESPDRLLDVTTLFLHRVVADLPEEKQRTLHRLNSSDEDLIGRSVLLVDDDPRNLFALSSVLERRGLNVLTASTGSEGINILNTHPNIAIVLMDIMIPEMDGYQTMQAIRKNPQWRRLPIVALTAKAMKGDREKCLEAGASDYLAKPVNTEQLFAALRMWLHR